LMGTEHNQHDEAIDKVLAALREAIPPEGMETRITQRLADHQTAAPAIAFHRRDWFAGSTSTGAWWRGAIAGAAAATLAICAVLLVQHRSRTTPGTVQTAVGNNTARPFSMSPHATPTSQSRATPCPHTTVFRVDTNLPVKPQEDLSVETYAESTAPSRPAPELPMTPQERSLARLVRTAPPGELATLSPETQARLEEEHAADFAKFFTPPPPPPVPERIPDVNPEATQQSSPEVAPPVNE
jgi:hypothetical protein